MEESKEILLFDLKPMLGLIVKNPSAFEYSSLQLFYMESVLSGLLYV